MPDIERYDLNIILDPGLSEAQIQTEKDSVNMQIERAGGTIAALDEWGIQRLAYPIPEEFQENAYPCIVHGVGMCDEYPKIDPIHRRINVYDGEVEKGMVLCIESYMGAVGERDGVKLEQQVLVTDDGYEPLSTYPFEECLLD